MLLADLAETSRAVAATRSRLRKVELLAAALRRMGPREVAVGVSYLAGDLRQGRIGIGVAAVREAMVTATPAERATLELTDVDAELDRVAGARGAGSAADRRRALASLLSGHGRRSGWLSNLHLGARDPDAGGFVMLGKTFKGMTDEMLAWQTEKLQALQLATDGHVVHVRPELVVEVAFHDLQASPRYPAGL